MNWLYRFMYGRYGADQLTFALIILYLILSLTLTLIPVPLIWLLAYIPMVFLSLIHILLSCGGRSGEKALHHRDSPSEYYGTAPYGTCLR